jgi:hypothetical protein
MTEPTWLREAVAQCPQEAAELERVTATLRATHGSACTHEHFVAVFTQMLTARDRLYEAWISRQLDEDPEHSGS